MSDIKQTNICCLDLTKDCIDYLSELGLSVFEGTLGSVINIDWNYIGASSDIPVLADYSFPRNIQEYHVFLHDMGNINTKEYCHTANNPKNDVEDVSKSFIACKRPITKFDLRPYGSELLKKCFETLGKEYKYISIVFLSDYHTVNYTINHVGYNSHHNTGPLNNYDVWMNDIGTMLFGKRVKLADNNLSSTLFQEHLNTIEYYRIFKEPTLWNQDKIISDNRYIPLLTDEVGRWVSFAYGQDNPTRFLFVFPQVSDKAKLLKTLFENILFKHFSDFFPDIEAKQWILNSDYDLPNEKTIHETIEAKTKEYEMTINSLREEERKVRESNRFLKELLTETGANLVGAVKSFLEYLGFKEIIDKDSFFKKGELREEDLSTDYKGKLILMEVKGINGTSTDSDCSQIDKVVLRKIRELNSPNVHGVYIVNNQKNIEPLKRTVPPFDKTKIEDAISQSRTMVYTAQLFALYSDIENGYISKDDARQSFLIPGLVDFHKSFISLGVPQKYYQDGTVLCFHLKDIVIRQGTSVYYIDELQRLVGVTIQDIQLDGKILEEVSSGEVSIKVSRRFPKGQEVFIKQL